MCCWHHLLSKQNDPECCDNDTICACVVAAVYHQALIGNVYGNALQRSWSRTCQASFDRDKVIFKMLHQTLAKSSVQLSVNLSVLYMDLWSSTVHDCLHPPGLHVFLGCIMLSVVCVGSILGCDSMSWKDEKPFSLPAERDPVCLSTSSLSQFAFHSVFTLFWQAVCVNEGISMYYLFQSLR